MIKTIKFFLIVLIIAIYSASFVYALNMGEILSAETRTGSLGNCRRTQCSKGPNYLAVLNPVGPVKTQLTLCQGSISKRKIQKYLGSDVLNLF